MTTWRWPKLRTTTGEQTSPGLGSRRQTRCVLAFDSEDITAIHFHPYDLPLVTWTWSHRASSPFRTNKKPPVIFVFFPSCSSCGPLAVQRLQHPNGLGGTNVVFSSAQAAIRKELNEFKSTEMEVHASSKHLTRSVCVAACVAACGRRMVMHAWAILGCDSLYLALLAHPESTMS